MTHRVFLDVEIVLKCGSCGATFDDLKDAKEHVLSPGPKILVESPKPYPCTEDGCERSFASEQGLGVHRARAHVRTVKTN